jgi:hypothetical protein
VKKGNALSPLFPPTSHQKIPLERAKKIAWNYNGRRQITSWIYNVIKT